jgi:hypothetical protein
MKLSTNINIEAFENYKSLGLDPLPIPYDNGHPSKVPKIGGWHTKASNGEYTADDFSEPCGVGILLGGTNNVTDIDCDSTEAVSTSSEIMRKLMDETGETMMFGHESKPRSRYVFSTDTSLPTEQIRDPVNGEMIIEYRCVNKDGGRGCQTVFPPSLRYDLETGVVEKIRLEEDSPTAPIFIEADKLHQQFRMIAVTALLAKHFPVKPRRHDTILALAGVFARNGMRMEKAVSIIELAYRHSGGYNGDSKKCEDDVRAVYEAYTKESATHLFGYPKLTEIMPKPVVDKVLELLGNDKSGARRLSLYPKSSRHPQEPLSIDKPVPSTATT